MGFVTDFNSATAVMSGISIDKETKMATIGDLHQARQDRPTHDQIEKRAYELYLKEGEECSPTEYWLRAEEALLQEYGKKRKAIKSRSATAESAPMSRKRLLNKNVAE